MRKRRKPVEWITTNYSAAPDFDGVNNGITPLITINYGGAGAVTPVINETPVLVGDEPDVANTLTEERKSYTIRRIVGDLHFMWGRVASVGTGGTAGAHPMMCKWGFAVKNVPPDVASLLPTGERVWDAFSATQRDFTESDWMSMRTEIYGANYGAYPQTGNTANTSPFFDNSWDAAGAIQKTGWYFPGSRHHHVDIRVNRTVRRNQRLFLNVAVAGLDFDPALYSWSNNPHKLLVYADLRCLINWRAAYNRKG